MNSSDRSAFTMIEMLVTIAILGIVMSLLATMYVRMAESMRVNTARANALESLTIISNSILGNLENMATNHDVMNASAFSLVGIDGDSGFENSTEKQYPELSDTPNALSDRLHFFTNNQNNLVSGDNATQHVYLAYWINGEKSEHSKPGLKKRYGLVVRRSTLSRADRVSKADGGGYPVIPVFGGQRAPLLDLTGDANHNSSHILGLYIDYLSFRYYDPKDDSDPWKNSWDTESKGYFPTIIQFAVRAYDSKVEETPDASDLMTPIWYQSAISLKGK